MNQNYFGKSEVRYINLSCSWIVLRKINKAEVLMDSFKIDKKPELLMDSF